MFSCEFWEISKKTVCTEHLRTTASAIEHFLKRNDFFIMKGDKGAATVRLDVKYYIAKDNEQLQDNSLYQKLNIDSTVKHSEIVNCAIESDNKNNITRSFMLILFII